MTATASTPAAVRRNDLLTLFENTIWRWLNSLPVATIVMILLAILSALGTFIPQEHLLSGQASMNPEAFYLERFGTERYQLIKFLGLTHIYFTPYFFILLLWLCVSAVVCNITRFRKTMHAWQKPPVERTVRGFSHDKRAVVVQCQTEQAVDKLKQDLTQHKFRIRELGSADGAHCIYADHGFIKKWALVLLHFSLIVLLFGAIFGKTVGTEGWIRLKDGTQQTLVLDVKENKRKLVLPLISWMKPLSYELSQDRFRIDYDEHLNLPADLAHLPPDAQEYYKYFVKDFVSILTAEQGGRKKTQEVKVNHPLVLNKLVLYQSDYQQDGYFEITGPDGVVKEYPAPAEVWMVLTPAGPAPAESAMSTGQPLSDHAFLLERIKDGDLYRQGKKAGHIGPLTLAHLANMNTTDETTQLVSTEQPFTVNVMGKPYTIKLSQKVDNYSGFSYKRDPGIPILYFGWISLIIGIALSLYLPFTQVWLRIEAGRVLMLAAAPGGTRAARKHYARWRDILVQP